MNKKRDTTTCYSEAVRIIPRVLGKRAMKTSEIYKTIAKERPDLCDDSVECIHDGKAYGQTEWRHEVRSAQQALKRAGIIERDPSSETWRRVK